jgi:hypothetical protein
MDAEELAAITAALQSWRQGDAVVGQQLFTHYADLAKPISPAASFAANEAAADGDPLGIEAIDTTERGLVVLTQTCDLIRPPNQRPYVEVAPLVEVSAAVLNEIRKRKRPNFVYVPALAHERLVGDLDRTMTVEKSIVAGWTHVVGCLSSEQQADFARALARKRARHAFPDEFGPVFRRFRDHSKEQRRRETPEGQYVDALIEIRVSADPDWDTANGALTYYFIVDEGELENEALNWPIQVEAWANMLVPNGWSLGAAIAVDLSTINAKIYLESAPIDTDDFSPDNQ